MADDRDKPRRPGTHRDYALERAAAPRHIDREATPPPQVDYDSIPPPVAVELRKLASGIERVWDSRDDGKRIDRLESKIDAYTQTSARNAALLDEAVMPTWRAIPGQFELVHNALAKVSSSITVLAETVKASADATRAQLNAIDERLVAVEETTTDHAAQLMLLEEARLVPRVKALEEERAAAAAGDKREVSLTTQRKGLLRHIWLVFAAIGGAIAGLFAAGK